MKRLEEDLFGEPPETVYALLRIVLGIAAFLMLVNSWSEMLELYSNQGYFTLEARQTVGRDGGFSLLAWNDSPGAVKVLYAMAMLLALAFALGMLTPISGWGLFLAWISISNRNTASAAGDELLVGMILFPLLFAPTARVLSLDRKLRGPGKKWGNRIPLRLLQFQLCVAYFFSGFYKAMGDEWLDGSATLVALMYPAVRRFPLEFWLHPWPVFFLKLFTWAVILWELLFPVLVLHPFTRRLALGFGVALHGGQFLMIDTGAFAPLMVSLYLCFLDSDAIAGRLGLKKDPTAEDPPREPAARSERPS